MISSLQFQQSTQNQIHKIKQLNIMMLGLYCRKGIVSLRNYNLFLFSRSQNFFQINPIYPDTNDKDFDLYNTDRKKISALDAFKKVYDRSEAIKKQVKNSLFLQKQRKVRGKKVKFDSDTGLPITGNPQLNEYISDFKKNKQLGLNVKKQFNQILYKLIKRFNTKSETQLIRILRISLANAKKGSYKQKIRAQIIRKAILTNASQNKMFRSPQSQKIEVNQKQIDQLAFQQALKQIDDKIEQAEKDLRYNKTGLKKTLSSFDPDYGWENVDDIEFNREFSLVTKRGPLQKIKQNFPVNIQNVQDSSIQKRISRLFFLERCRLIEKSDNDPNFNYAKNTQLPINLRGADKVINELARMYKEAELQVVPDIDQIYEEVDIALNKIFIRSTIKKQGNPMKIQDRYQVQEVLFRKEDLIWKDMDIEEVFTPNVYLPQSISQKGIEHVTPSAEAQLSLNRLPFNLYRHSELQVFGVFNKYKQFILKNFLNNQTIDPSNQFKVFDVVSSKRKLEKAQKLAQKATKFIGHGIRKSAYATVCIQPGTGVVRVNGGLLKDYFPDPYDKGQALKPLVYTDLAGSIDVQITVRGSGLRAQSNCVAYALSQAILRMDKSHYDVIKELGMHKKDPRRMQQKRIGLYSARVRPPFVRR